MAYGENLSLAGNLLTPSPPPPPPSIEKLFPARHTQCSVRVAGIKKTGGGPRGTPPFRGLAPTHFVRVREVRGATRVARVGGECWSCARAPRFTCVPRFEVSPSSLRRQTVGFFERINASL